MSPIYFILIALSVILLSFRNDKSKMYQTLGILFLFLIYFIGAFRDASIGTDIALNEDGYHLLWTNPFHYYRDMEKGFVYLTYIIKTLIPSYYIYYSVIYIITLSFFCASAKRLGVNRYGFIAILFLAGYLHISFNIIRQMLAMSIALYIYSLYFSKTFDVLENENKTRYIKNTIFFELLLLILAFTMHGSVLILSIVPLFDIKAICRFLDHDSVLFALLGLTIYISVVGHDHIIIALTFLEGYFGSRADTYIIDYVSNSETYEASHGYITSLVNGMIAILISKGRRNKFFYLGFWGILFTEIASSGLGTIGRTFYMLQYFINLYYCQIWYKSSPKSTTYNQTKMTFVKILRVFFWLSSLYYTLLLNNSVNPYKTFLF